MDRGRMTINARLKQPPFTVSTYLLHSCIAIVYLLLLLSLCSPARSVHHTHRHRPTPVLPASLDIWRNISVPFYLYQDILDAYRKHCPNVDPYWQKGVSYFWFAQIENHEWRTQNPHDALLYIIPADFDAISHGDCDKDRRLLYKLTYEVLDESEVFHRYGGKDHVVISTYFKSRTIPHAGLKKILKDVIRLDRLDDTMHGHCQVPLLHNAPAPLRASLAEVTVPKINRTHTLFFVGQADSRKKYVPRVIGVQKLQDVGLDNVLLVSNCMQKKNPYFTLCTEGQMKGCCADLSRKDFLRLQRSSKWNLMFAGDDAGSSRLPEAIAMDVPSFILSRGVEHYLSFSCLVPWDLFTVRVDVDTFTSHPAKTIATLLEKNEDRWERMRHIQAQYAPHVLWSYPEGYTARNTIVDVVRKCFPGRVPISIPTIPCRHTHTDLSSL